MFIFFPGTVLVLAILDESSLYVANVGDCRGVMRNSLGEVIPLSFDHKPNHVIMYFSLVIYCLIYHDVCLITKDNYIFRKKRKNALKKQEVLLNTMECGESMEYSQSPGHLETTI